MGCQLLSKSVDPPIVVLLEYTLRLLDDRVKVVLILNTCRQDAVTLQL